MAGNPLVRSRGTFIILEIERLKSGDYRLKCADCYDGSLRMIQGSMIYMIDGMTPERFALTFNLSPTGEPVRLPKRRGRKPSKKQMEM